MYHEYTRIERLGGNVRNTLETQIEECVHGGSGEKRLLWLY